MIERQKKRTKKTIDNTVNKNISYFYMQVLGDFGEWLTLLSSVTRSLLAKQ